MGSNLVTLSLKTKKFLSLTSYKISCLSYNISTLYLIVKIPSILYDVKERNFFVSKGRFTKFQPTLGDHQELGNTNFQQNPSSFVDTGPKNDFAGLLNRTIAKVGN